MSKDHLKGLSPQEVFFLGLYTNIYHKVTREGKKSHESWLGGDFIFFYFHPYLEKIPILTNIFQMGWNHQPEDYGRLGATNLVHDSPELQPTTAAGDIIHIRWTGGASWKLKAVSSCDIFTVSFVGGG